MKNFFIDLGITTLVFFPVFIFTFAMLWRLKSRGFYTIFLGLFFGVIMQLIGYVIAPQTMQYHRGPGIGSVLQGILGGCCVPMSLMVFYHLGQRQKKSNGLKPNKE